MKKISLLFIVSLLLSVSSTAAAVEATLGGTTITTTVSTTASATVFTRTLNTGATGRDVMALKKILGLEVGVTDTSNIFNSTTLGGVIKLQNKYAVEILIPLGISAGTGFVGQATIKKLNQLATQYNIKLTDFAVVDTTRTLTTTKQVFTQSLSLGSTGDEVLLLKTILNSEVQAGLPLTNVFDLATKIAVIKFQEKYASIILTPNGLTAGTGFVGPSTRVKLNSLLQTSLASSGNQTFTTNTGGNVTVTNTTQTTNTSGQTTSFTSSASGVASTTLCPIYNYQYGAWGTCSSAGIQTRTITVTTVGQATCPYKNLAQQATTSSCTPPPIPPTPNCGNDGVIEIGGHIATHGQCINTLFEIFSLKDDAKFFNSSGNKCNFNGYFIYPAPLKTLTSFLGVGAPGYLANAPAGWAIVGKTTDIKIACTLWDGSNIVTRQMNISNTVIDANAY